MTKVAITGAHGFLGWHTSCRILATRGITPVRLGREEFDSPEKLAAALTDVETVIHIAGVNRAESDDVVEQGNIELATQLATALGSRAVHIVFANSVQADVDNPYGRGKAQAAAVLRALPGTFADVMLPNLFGEHGRPGYNSFVATFVHEVVNGRQPNVSGDRQIPLLHAQDAAEALIAAAESRNDADVRPAGEEHGIGEVLTLLNGFHARYPQSGEFPDVSSSFALDLFNTYRAALWPAGYPIHPQVHSDTRGDLIEAFRAHGPAGQGYVSTTLPGKVRGEHYHLRKIERFIVFRGEAEIQLRKLFTDEVITFRVGGDAPAYLDMPTMWVHNLRNVGADELITVFWSDQLLDPNNPDQYYETVALQEATP